MQIHSQPSEFRNLMIRPNPGAFFHFLSIFLIPPHHLFPQPSFWALPSGAGALEMDSALVLQPRGLECEPGTTAADCRIIYAALLWLFFFICLWWAPWPLKHVTAIKRGVISKNCNLQRLAWRCTSVEQSKLKGMLAYVGLVEKPINLS